MKSTTPNATGHLADARNIVDAITRSQPRSVFASRIHNDKLSRLSSLKRYQRFLLAKFAAVIQKPSFVYISKTGDSWLIVGDRRQEVASDIQLIIERYGLGVGMLVLHLQQIRAGHLLMRISVGGRVRQLAAPTEQLRGAHGERVASIPIREFRTDFDRLAQSNIAKPLALWDRAGIVTHERDQFPCFYCSCPEINPAEVVVELDGPRHGLSRHYGLGFTFAPFGNPLSVVHFLAWDRAREPLNMNRVPMTVSDLVKLTREINLSIRTFFAETGIRDYPVLDGLSNGWAGNTIYHQHFQFYQPEHPAPIVRARPKRGTAMIRRDDVTVERLCWPAPVYRVRAADALNTGLVGNDLAGIWRLLGGSRKVPYKPFRDGYTPTEGEKVHAHTQNLYIPGHHLGRTAFVVLRDRERVDFNPDPDEFVNRPARRKAQAKRNIGVLEVTGTLIVDDRSGFEVMRRWTPAEISQQMSRLIAAIGPAADKVAEFETAVRELFPR